MKFFQAVLIVVCLLTAVSAQEKTPDGPTDEKAQKTYQKALASVQDHKTLDALDDFKKADKQDSGHCLACQMKILKYGVELRDWKATETAAGEMVSEAKNDKDAALAHYEYGVVLLNEGIDKHKDELFARAHDELTKALTAAPRFPQAVFGDGLALARMKQDDAAKQCFQKFIEMSANDTPDRQRAQRYLSDPALVRARMAPPFEVTTVDGQRISLDGLQGKVVLIDFWATWCGPCREALPHVKEIARRFQGQPLVVLSISLDSDQQKWRQFITQNEMTWPQYFDGGFGGNIAKLFDVHSIPHTFTIDADGILQDEHIGDASIEGKLKKLIKHAQEMQPPAATQP